MAETCLVTSHLPILCCQALYPCLHYAASTIRHIPLETAASVFKLQMTVILGE